jgi:hypothetical protein
MINGQILDNLIELSKDPIANVRMNVVKTFKSLNNGIREKVIFLL